MKGVRKLAKVKVVISIVALLLVLTAVAATYYLKFYKEDLNRSLPMTVTISADGDLEGVAYKFWLNYMQRFTEDDISPWKKLSDVRFNDFQLIAGDEDEFAVAVTFWAKLEKKKWSTHHNWGTVQADGTVRNIQWTLRIKKTGENVYQLVRIEDTASALGGLSPIEHKYQKDAGIEVSNPDYQYQLENGKLNVTYDNGGRWQSVPVSIEELFAGEYSGSKQALIDGSYVIDPAKTAFVVGEEKVTDDGGYAGMELNVLVSTNKGRTWDKVHVPGSFPSIRFRMIGFTSEKNGYLIVTGERTMSFEAHHVYKTNDGGKSWTEKSPVKETNGMITDGGFVDDQLGFISFGSIVVNQEPERPSLYRTIDGGSQWTEVEIPIPLEYKGIFTVAQVPTFDGTQGILLVNQGPNGDYQGGKVLARFISVDEGATWNFADLVDPDNAIEK